MFPKTIECPCVLVVHDLHHVFFPQNLSWIQNAYRRRLYPYSIEHADRIIAISEFTKRTVMQQCGVASTKITVVPHGCQQPGCDSVGPLLGCTGKYVYYSAATLPHKGHAVLFRSVAQLRRQGRFKYRMVLSGVQTPYWKKLRRQIKRLGLEDIVVQLGYLPYRQVWGLYRGAECILFPTSFEGVGLPVLEAAAFRKRVIVSRLEVFEELGVPERFRIDFADPRQLHRALAETGPTVLQRRPSTWRECAGRTMEVLRSTAEGAQTPSLYGLLAEPDGVPARVPPVEPETDILFMNLYCERTEGARAKLTAASAGTDRRAKISA